tara:strand:+ start:1403 stop:1696 length:294 start_codon:yes stop_codon:yes gene_type:complete
MIYLKMLALATFLTTMVACNPLIGVSSFVHSLSTGNALGIVTGGAGIVVEQRTGKSPMEHLTGDLMPKPKPKPKPVPKDNKLEWSFERLSTVMNQYD